MSRKYRYEFTKKVHPNYIVFIKVNDKYVTYGLDLDIVNYLIDKNRVYSYKWKKYKKVNRFKLLDKERINYLILDNLDMVVKKDYNMDNSYDRYMTLIVLNKIIRSIGNNLVKTSLL